MTGDEIELSQELADDLAEALERARRD
jgi:hypothetical protein